MRLVDVVVLFVLTYLGVRRLGSPTMAVLVLIYWTSGCALFPCSERLRWEFYFTVDFLLAAVLSAVYTLKHHWRSGPKL